MLTTPNIPSKQYHNPHKTPVGKEENLMICKAVSVCITAKRIYIYIYIYIYILYIYILYIYIYNIYNNTYYMSQSVIW